MNEGPSGVEEMIQSQPLESRQAPLFSCHGKRVKANLHTAPNGADRRAYQQPHQPIHFNHLSSNNHSATDIGDL